MHVPLHAMRPAWQLSSHTPLLQTSPASHVSPAFAPSQSAVAPQCMRSVSGSMQPPPHASSPAGHDNAHAPSLHTSPAPQTLPHAPQFVLSAWTLTHVEPHS